MTKTQKKNELSSLLVDFSASENHHDAILINDKIFKEVLDCPFSPKALYLLNHSITIWKVDVSNYLTTFSNHGNTYRHLAYVAFRGIINLIDISELQD